MECKTCGTEFKPKMKTHVYCSAYCRNKYRELGDNRRVKMNAYRLEWKSKNKERAYSLYRDNHLRRNFGISLVQYEEILTQQGGGCGVCGKTAEDEKRSLAVDHDHKTGEIFGLLCYVCNNKLIGRRRDPKQYLKAYEYLSNGTGLFVPENRKTRRKKRKKKLNENSNS